MGKGFGFVLFVLGLAAIFYESIPLLSSLGDAFRETSIILGAILVVIGVVVFMVPKKSFR